MICTDIPAPVYFFFSDSVPQLLYYSHIPTAITVLLMGIFVYMQNKSLASKILLYLSITFALWLFLNLALWTNVNSNTVMFLWTLSGILSPMLFLLMLYFTAVFIQKCDTKFVWKFFFVLLVTPLVLLHQQIATSFNLSYCESDGLPLYINLFYTFEFFITIFLLFYGYREITKEKNPFIRTQILLLVGSVFLFLFSFFTANLLASYLEEYGYTNSFELEQYGLFGMTFFIGMLGYLIVKYKAFNIKLIGAQALMVALWFLVGSLAFVAVSNTTRVIAGITLVFTTIVGYFLVRSIKKEVKQREQLEELTEQLAKANERLKVLDKMKSEFVSIASHQLRSPLTSIRGYASMLAEGSYGKIPEKAREAIEKIGESSMFMVRSVEDYLSVSRIEAGNMKYEMSDFNLRELTEKIVDEMRPVALKKGLIMVFRSDCNGSALVHADIGKTRQVIMNLIDNSMKYTQKGTITLVAHDDVKKKTIRVTIQDTGVGMSKETQEEVFDKFVRAKNANEINVTGTGLGLYVAKKMTTEMGGKIWAESEGEGKGSTFIVEFSMLPGKAGR